MRFADGSFTLSIPKGKFPHAKDNMPDHAVIDVYTTKDGKPMLIAVFIQHIEPWDTPTPDKHKSQFALSSVNFTKLMEINDLKLNHLGQTFTGPVVATTDAPAFDQLNGTTGLAAIFASGASRLLSNPTALTVAVGGTAAFVGTLMGAV